MASLGSNLSPLTASEDISGFSNNASAGKTRAGSVFRVRRSLFVATDLLGIWGGALLAVGCRFPEGISGAHQTYTIAGHIGIVVLYSVLIVLFCHTQRLYSAYQTASGRKEMWAIVKAVAMASILLTCSLFVSGVKSTSRLVIGATAISAIFCMTGWRYYRRQSLRKAVADGLTCQNVLVVGTDRLARSVRDHLKQQPQLGFVVLGMLATNEKGARGEHTVGGVEELRTLCRTHFVDEIMICVQDRDIIKRVLDEARDCGVGVRIIPDLFDGTAWGTRVDYLGDIPTLPVIHRHVPAVELKLKRALDVAVSAGVLLFLSPLLLLLAIIIKLDSRGPVFYKSQRVGKKGRIFSCYKFRTMRSDAEQLKAKLLHLNERDGILFKIKDDPRITRFGRVMRKYSLDEFAQLWNVLRGDMSLVGPRPPLASEVKQYQLEYLRRLDVAPGITGLWQVEARMSPSFDRYIALDLHYVETWSIVLDLQILFRTVAVVFAGTGA